MMNAFSNAIALVTNPAKFLREHKDTPVTVKDILVNYVAVLALVPFVATLLEWTVYYAYFGLVGYALVEAILTYILDVVSVFIVGFVIWKLGPSFATQADQAHSTLLAAFVYTPALLISILNIVPFLGVLSFLGLLYGIYILYIGLPIVFNTPSDKLVVYVIATLVASFVIAYVVGAVVGGVSVALFLRSIYPFY